VWTVDAGAVGAAGLVLQPAGAEVTDAVRTAPTTPPGAQLVDWTCRRCGLACAHRDAKSEVGWGDCQAQKYRAWEQH
jgi:hypothetical protein